MDNRIKALFNYWVHLRTKVMEFEVLFNDDKDAVELRNELLPDFFQEINELYWENFLISISRLLDAHNQGQNTNLTLFTLSQILKEKNIDSWHSLNEKVVALKEKYKDITFYRKKHLAHFDLEYTTGNKEFNSSTHINEVVDFLASMHEFINYTLEAIGEPIKSNLVMYPGRYLGARALMRILENEKRSRFI